MSIRHLLVTAAPPGDAADYVSGLTPGRFWGTLTAALAAIGVVAGWRALVRAADRKRIAGTRRLSAASLTLGAIGLAGGAIVAAMAEGGPGTGYGIVGAGISLVLGLASVVVGGLALSRVHRTGQPVA